MPRRLSRRERQVIQGIAAGRTTKELANLLGIAPSTVDWHVANALAKLRASNRAEAVAIALRRGDLASGRFEQLRDLAAVWVATRWGMAATALLLAVLLPLIVASDTVRNDTRTDRPSASPGNVRPSRSVPPSAPASPSPLIATGPPASSAPPASSPPPTLPSPTASLSPTPAPPPTEPSRATVSPVPVSSALPTLPPLPTAVPTLPLSTAVPTLPLSTALPVGPSPTSIPTVGPLPSALPSPSPLPSLP